MINIIVLIPFVALLVIAILSIIKNRKKGGCAGCTACKDKDIKNCPVHNIDFSKYETKDKENEN